MNQIHDVVRLILTSPGLGNRDIARSLGVSKTTVLRYRTLLKSQGTTWADLQGLSLRELNDLLNPPSAARPRRPLLDVAAIDRALADPSMTLWTWWAMERGAQPGAIPSYPQTAKLYRKHRRRQPAAMRQIHIPGEKVFVDYSGRRPWYQDRATGRPVPVELFVGVLGASNYIFALCTPSQTVPDWLHAHVDMFAHFGGAPQILVPDNLKSAITKVGSPPVVQRNYLELAEHYGSAVLAARPYRPKDKSKAEGSVLLVQRAFLPLLRHHTFFSIEELNVALAARVAQVNARPFQKRPKSRLELFREVEQPALRPLPPEPYVFAAWVSKQTVPADHHIQVEGHHYSVPYTAIGKPVEARVTRSTVEFLCDRAVLARHPRSSDVGGTTTDTAHQPPAHQAQGERTLPHFLAWAQETGPHTLALVQAQLNRKVPLQGLPACDALRGLGRKHGAEAMEAAAARAMAARTTSPSSVQRLLTSLTLPPAPPVAGEAPRRERGRSAPTCDPVGVRRSAVGSLTPAPPGHTAWPQRRRRAAAPLPPMERAGGGSGDDR